MTYVKDIQENIGDEHKVIKKIDLDVSNMQEAWYGKDYQTNKSYINNEMKEKATELSKKAL